MSAIVTIDAGEGPVAIVFRDYEKAMAWRDLQEEKGNIVFDVLPIMPKSYVEKQPKE